MVPHGSGKRPFPALAIAVSLSSSLGCFPYSFDSSVISAKVEQRLSFARNDFFDLGNEKRVVASRIRFLKTALQACERSVQNWSSTLRSGETCARTGSLAPSYCGQSVELRNPSLALCQYVDPEALPRLQIFMRAVLSIDTHQHQRRVHRDSCESIGGHAVHISFVLHGDDRYSSRKAPARSAEIH